MESIELGMIKKQSKIFQDRKNKVKTSNKKSFFVLNGRKIDLENVSPIDCYFYARDFGHATELENRVLRGNMPYVNYIYARNIPGANILKHINCIKRSKLDKGEKNVILYELKFLLNHEQN